MKQMLVVVWLLFTVLSPLAAQEFYDPMRIHDLRITFSARDWDRQLDSLKNLVSDERLAAQLTIDGQRFDSVGVRYKGNSSYFSVRNAGEEKLPFNIKLNFVNKKQLLPGGYKTLKLSNSFRDPTFLREVLAYQIAGQYLPSPGVTFARLYINDRYYGLYHCTESVDDRFVRKHYGDAAGAFFKCDPDWRAAAGAYCPAGDKASLTDLGPDTTCYLPWYEIKSDTGWNALIRLVQQLNHQPQNIEQVLDVDQVLWMHAFNNALLNLDSYAGRLCHNYYVYEDSLGVFHPILWDMNLAFGGFRLDGAEDHPLSDEELAQLSPFLHLKNKNPERPLITQLLATPLYRKMYVAHIKTILEEQLRSGAWEKVLVDVHKRIAPEVSRDSLKLYTQEDFQRNLDSTLQVGGASVPGLRTLLLRRTTHLGDHPLLKKEAPVIQTPVVQ